MSRLPSHLVLRLAAVLLSLSQLGCEATCFRHSDCFSPYICSASGECVPPPADAGTYPDADTFTPIPDLPDSGDLDGGF